MDPVFFNKGQGNLYISIVYCNTYIVYIGTSPKIISNFKQMISF